MALGHLRDVQADRLVTIKEPAKGAEGQ